MQDLKIFCLPDFGMQIYVDHGQLAGLADAVRRGRMIKCKTCGQKGATLGCHHKSCRLSYHLNCARKSSCLVQVGPLMQLQDGHGHVLSKLLHDSNCQLWSSGLPLLKPCNMPGSGPLVLARLHKIPNLVDIVNLPCSRIKHSMHCTQDAEHTDKSGSSSQQLYQPPCTCLPALTRALMAVLLSANH